MSGLFSGIKDAKWSEGGVFFLEGLYLVEVEKVKLAKSRKGVQFVAVECKILQSDNPQRRVGTSVSQLFMSDKDAFLGNVKNFVAVASECDEQEIDEAGVEMVISEENPLAGTILKVEASMIKTRAGGDFTKVVWKQPTDSEKAPFVKKPMA